jgi:hypothetical protein
VREGKSFCLRRQSSKVAARNLSPNGRDPPQPHARPVTPGKKINPSDNGVEPVVGEDTFSGRWLIGTPLTRAYPLQYDAFHEVGRFFDE